MQRSLTIRYLIALGLVATMLVSVHVLQERTVALGAHDGHTINIAGRQRMLSQRVALLAREVAESDSAEQADPLLAKLVKAADTMADTHARLLDPDGPARRSLELDALYRGADGVDARMQRFLASARRFVAHYRSAGPTSAALIEEVETLAAIARNGFLRELDAVVNAYEQASATTVERLRRVIEAALIAGLVLLALEALFIFRPMVALVQRQISALEQRNRELHEFSYRISHDLRAPISSSIGLVSIARDAVNDEAWDMADMTLDRIDGSLHRLDDLIEDVIEVTRVHQAAIAVEPVDLDTLLDEVVASLGEMPNHEHAVIDRRIELTGPVLAKRTFLARILENLLSNALKYAKPDGQSVHIEIRASGTPTAYRIEFDDTGIGVPEAHRSELFGLFKRFHPGVANGSGLGLYLVQQYANAMQGRVIYSPRPDGSRFTLEIGTARGLDAA